MTEDGGVGAGGGNFTFGGTTLSEFLSCVVKIHLHAPSLTASLSDADLIINISRL